MDSHFPCSFPIIQYTFPNPCRHGLSQQTPLAAPCWLRGGPGSPFAAPSTTHQPLSDEGSCPEPELLGVVGSVPGFEAGGGE